MREGTLTMSHEAAYRTLDPKAKHYNPRFVFNAKALAALADEHNSHPGRNHTITHVIIHGA